MKTYSTFDLYLATALKLHGFKLMKFESDGHGRGSFIFEDREDRSQYVTKYFSGELQGSLKSFVNCWKDLKGLFYESRNEGGK